MPVPGAARQARLNFAAFAKPCRRGAEGGIRPQCRAPSQSAEEIEQSPELRSALFRLNLNLATHSALPRRDHQGGVVVPEF
jgi:hypothetical protein